MSLDDVLPALACPHCAAGLERIAAALGCRNGHRFDIARQGYVSLLGAGSRTDTGDSAEMVQARIAFLAAGHYAPISAALTAAVTAAAPTLLVEVGAGTAYYLAGALTELPAAAGIALDASARAARPAAAAHPRIGSIVADAWSRLPVRDAAADVVLSVFAPRNPAELARITAAGGLLVVVTPAPDHLAELIGPFGMLSVGAQKDTRLADSLGGHFAAVEARLLRFRLALSRADLRNLVLMGPAARHVDRTQLDGALAAAAETTTATASVRVSVWRRGSS